MTTQPGSARGDEGDSSGPTVLAHSPAGLRAEGLTVMLSVARGWGPPVDSIVQLLCLALY